MKRREFIGLLGGAAAWPVAGRAQQPDRAKRIGVVMAIAGPHGRRGFLRAVGRGSAVAAVATLFEAEAYGPIIDS